MEVQLTVVEKAKLENLEMVVDDNINSALKVALALRTIRDERLWREASLTFEEYALARFGFHRTRALQLIDWANVTDAIVTNGDTVPNERQARELARLKTAEEQQEAWEESLSATEGDPAAKDVQEVVDKKIGPRKPKKPKEFDHYQHAWTLCDEMENDIGEITEPDDLDSLSTRLNAMATLCDQKAEHEPQLKRDK